MPLPSFEVVERQRPFALVSPALVELASAERMGTAPLPQPAPSTALVATTWDGPAELTLASGPVRLTAHWRAADAVVELSVDDGTTTTTHRSRRRGLVRRPPLALALTLTGHHVTLITHDESRWHPRARVDLSERGIDVRDETFLAGLTAAWSGVTSLSAGGFGQLGLRDLRFATAADGTPVLHAGELVLTATHAGPGFFDTAHTGVWSLHPDTLELTHLSDLFFRRPDAPGVYGDHSTHLVRDDERWLVATSTWGDFVPPARSKRSTRPAPRVTVTLAETGADLLTGRHVLDTRPLALPDDGLDSVAVWDPHLVHTEEGWLVGYVSATEFFRFHPVLATGPTLDDLTLRAAARDRVATEGTTLVHDGEGWRVLASDGRDGRRGQRESFPVLDLDLRDLGRLEAPYPSNLPWPNLATLADGSRLMATFDGTPWETRRDGSLLGYGTHGDVVLMRGGARAGVRGGVRGGVPLSP